MMKPGFAPFYKLPNDPSLYKLVVENQTKEMTTEDLKKLGQKVYEEEDCVYCLCVKPNIVFENCAHMCLCKDCYATIKDQMCPMCRQRITSVITIKAEDLAPAAGAGGDESEEEKKEEAPAPKKAAQKAAVKADGKAAKAAVKNAPAPAAPKEPVAPIKVVKKVTKVVRK